MGWKLKVISVTFKWDGALSYGSGTNITGIKINGVNISNGATYSLRSGDIIIVNTRGEDTWAYRGSHQVFGSGASARCVVPNNMEGLGILEIGWNSMRGIGIFDYCVSRIGICESWLFTIND